MIVKTTSTNVRNEQKNHRQARRSCAAMSLACKRAVKFPALHNNIIKGHNATRGSQESFQRNRSTEVQNYRNSVPPAGVHHGSNKTNAMDSVTIWSRLVNQLGSSCCLELEMAKDDR
ncbi:uncharacterized protein LOC108104080 [Drosophila eugracilis]|uniref:uncharacterized protein LOC108104080 n=1 Tax=Drosophila eugracilis TaxID=29029 RepID=UPI001BDB2146|nr:uncharacterized protein LOC108104080 [Drosophila eugracilis]